MLKLPRLSTNWQNQPNLLERYWNIAMREIENLLNQITQIPVIEEGLAALQDDIDAAAALAQEAKDTADATASASGTNFAEVSLNNSYVANFVSPILSADDAGNITVATHDRVYGDSTLNPTVSVTGAVVATGATDGDVVRIYYEDSSRAGGSVTYQFTVDPAPPPAQSGNTHVVAAVRIPPAAGTGEGIEQKPPGYIEIP